MKIFITGATGVIGSRAIPLLMERGHQITAVARSAAKREALSRKGVRAIELDLFSLDAVRSAVEGHDAVINLVTSVPASSKAFLPGAWRGTARIRRYVSANVASAAREAGVARLIQESFAPIYADGGDRWLTETSPTKPARYNRAVSEAESAVARFSTGGGAGIVLRFAFLYGPDSDFTADAIKMVRKGWAPVIGSRDAYISSVSHDDAAAAVVAAMRAEEGVYNVSDDEPLTKREFYEALAKTLNVPAPKYPPAWLSYLLGSLGETLGRSQRLSNAKLRATGWTPRYASVRAGWPAVVAKAK